MRDVKITIIGGGSRQWAIGMLKDLTRQDKFIPHVCLYDINRQAAKDNVEIAKRIYALNKAEGFGISEEGTLEAALTGADFVIISVEPGIIECRQGDLELPDYYGILQTVGDTTGPGGILRARRAIPLFVEFAKNIERFCPNAWVINYTNPMTLCTAALFKGFPGIKAMGCCHEVFHIQTFLAEKCKDWYGVTLNRRDIEIDVSGVNHFTFMPKASWNGHDLIERTKQFIAEEADTVFADKTDIAKHYRDNELWFDCQRVIALSFLRDYGILGAAGDRHLAEFVPFFLTSEKDVLKYGITRTPYWWRLKQDRYKHSKTFTDEELIAKPNDEEGIDIMLSLLGERTLHTNVNVINKGQVPYLPIGHVVESMSDISCDSIKPVTATRLPLEVEKLEQIVASVQAKTLDAVLNNDDELLFEAFLEDPLMNLSRRTARVLFNRMLEASEIRY
ncbi:MAG: alpha-galactosidase [Sphaerochaetaceae bacterium]|nr:alpha-galactosidase [Sphaerochaetaceae bacterium]